MDLFDAIILSIIEGLTEFLPISSTGHLVLATHLLNIPQTSFVKSFEVSIQLGAILAVVILYFKTLTTNKTLWPKLLTAFLPTAMLGLIFYQIVKNLLIGNLAVTLIALFLGGVILILFERFFKEQERISKFEDMNLKQAFMIGLFQSISMIPGVSRAAASIIGGMLIGLKRKPAVEFSFLLAIPTMFAATSLDLYKSGFNFTYSEWGLLGLGFTGSFLTAILAIKFFLRFIQDHSFLLFGIYRILLALIFYTALV